MLFYNVYRNNLFDVSLFQLNIIFYDIPIWNGLALQTISFLNDLNAMLSDNNKNIFIASPSSH